MRRLMFVLIAALAVLTVRPGLGFGDLHRSIRVGDSERRYDLHVPKQYPGQPLPLVIVLHGGIGNAFSAKVDSGMSRHADSSGFIVAYPQGTPEFTGCFRTWNAAGCCGTASKRNVDDIAFIRSVIEQVKSDYSIDKNRIYITGLSNGGMLAYRIASELSGTIAAVATVEGCLVSPLKPAASPVSVIAFHGTNDHVLPYNGGTGSFFGYKIHALPVDSAISYWRQQDGCSPKPEETADAGLLKQTFVGGKNGTEVCLYTASGGHSWPVVRNLCSTFYDPDNHWTTSDIICDFFAAHPKH